jgi:Ca2+-binding RTX toxin-like protein
MSPWTIRKRRRRNFARLAVLVAMSLALLTVMSSAQGSPSDEDAKAVANAIDSFTNRLSSASDALGEFGDLANNLPLTDLAPGDPDGLDLSELLKDKLGTLAGNYANLGALAAAIETKDDTVGPLKIQFGTGTLKPGQDPVSATATSITIPVHAQHHVDQPLTFKFGVVDMAGGSLGVDFELDTSFTFHVDSAAITSAATAPPTALSLDAPTINLCAHATAAIGLFTARFGFTDVKLSTDDPSTTGTTETAKLHTCAEVEFQDPDSVGGITLDEWTSHALSELVDHADTLKGNPSGDDLDIKLFADASLVNGDAFAANTAADASIRFQDANLSDGFNPTPTPTVSPGLQAWLNISAGDVANGLQQFVAGLAGTQNLGGGKLPFLDTSLTDVFNTDTFSAVKPLSDYVSQLTNATVGCGTVKGADATHFPTGFTDNLTTGTLVYCRASTNLDKETGTVAWSVPADATSRVDASCAECGPLSPGTLEDTLGANGATPSTDFVFKMKAPGNFTAQVSWDAKVGAGTDTKTAIPRPGSAQELFQRLAAAAGLDDDLGNNLGYDAATKSLTFRLQHDPFNSPNINLGADIGDLLRNKTNIAGLVDASAGFQAGVNGIQFDLTFGVSLVANTSDITPLRGTATGGSSGNTLEDTSADFTDGTNDPRIGQVVKKTGVDPIPTCTITAIAQHTLTCALPSGSWASGNTYDVDGGLADRFYVKTDPAAPEFSVDDLHVTGSASLKGTVGFLEIAAGIDTTDGTVGVSKADSSKPVLAIDIKTPNSNAFTIDTGGGPTPIANAIGVSDLLFHLDSAHVGTVCNLKANANLGISATVDGKQLASGGVTVDWPTAFKANTCEPDLSTLDIDADTDFNLNLRDFDPFPSVTGTHNGGTADNLHDTAKNFKKVGFDPSGQPSPDGGSRLLNLTLKNKTTGASCTIKTIEDNELQCTLSGGTRTGDTGNNNKWKDGDEYEVEGNALAFLSYILDNLDTLVDQIDKLSPGITDQELPLIGISTKELVGKIKSIKETTDELRGAPAAQVDCTGNPDGTNPPGFNLQQVPDGTTVFCRAITTAKPTAVEWSQIDGTVTVVGAVKPNLDPADARDTVGSSPEAREQITVSDGDATQSNDTAISEWRVGVKFTDAAGDHNAEFPTAGAPRSLQDLGDMLSEKIGVDHVIQFEVLDLPAKGAGPRRTGTASNGSVADNVLEDNGANFPSLPEANRPFAGNLLINETNGHYCTITAVDSDTLTCAVGSGMGWSSGDKYQVVGDNTKDLVVRLGFGFCTGGGVTCEDTDQDVDALSAPLNFKDDFANIVGVESNGSINLDYAVRAHLDLGIPIKLGVPDIAVLDTSGASLEGNLNAPGIGLSAAIGPLSVEIGTAANGGTGSGIGKLGAKLSLESDSDTVANNKTMSFGDFFSAVGSNASFAGVNQQCDSPAGGSVEAQGDACAVLTMSALGQNFGNITVECTLGTLGNPPSCDAELPQALKDLINGEGLDWSLLIKVLPQILANLQKTLDGAAQDIHIPVIGDALDAGANVVGVFNEKVVTPFSQLVTDLQTAGNQDGDSDTDAYDVAIVARDFIWSKLGPSPGAGLLQDANGVGGVTKADIVVTPLCGAAAVVCANGEGVTSNLIRDFRVTFLMGQGIDDDLPFDIGLKGLPLRLQGGVHGSGSWRLLVDFGLSLKDGPYIVANGKKGTTGTETRTGGDTSVRTFLEDNNTDFNGSDNSDPADDLVELGMWLQNTTTGQGCRVTKVEEHKLYCTQIGRADDATVAEADSASWNGTDEYELVARHAPDTPGSDGAAELNLNATVSMANASAACTGDATSFPAGFEYLNGYDNDRCLKGQIAFLQVIVRDKTGTQGSANATCDNLTADDPTALMLCASLDFKSSTSRVTFSDLVAGNFSFDPKLGGKANINVRLRTGLNVAANQTAGFPSILGKFHLFWGFSVSPSQGLNVDDLDVGFDGLTLDAGKFITEFLGPIIKQVKEITNPLMPVVEMLQGEVPIVSDLSKLIGQGPVTVLDLLEAISGNDLSLMRSILQMIKFVNSLPGDGNLLIGLGSHSPGSFDVSGKTASSSPLLPDSPEQPFENPDAGTDLVNKLGENGSPYQSAKTPPAECDRKATFGVCGLSFPFLGNATEIFGVLMGKDTTLVEYDAGTFGAGAGFDFCFPPILIGPVPVQICIGGSFRVDGRFAMGYDTSGLRKVLSGGSGTHLLDGIFLDDYDSNGVDVPEIKFTGTVYAEGAVSVYIFKVGIRGEIIFTAGLNLHEDQPQDGKLRIEEIVAHIFNPLCLFDVEGKIEAALSAFVKIDLFITSVEFSIQIVKVTLLEFKLDICNVTPKLAHNETAGNVEKLVLNMGSGSLRTQRGIAPLEESEKFTVRQMEAITGGPNNGKTRFSVTAFGIQQDYFLTTSKVGTDQAFLIANADTKDDVVSLLAGSASGDQGHPDQQKPPIPFTLWADISAGTGNDEISTGEGNDTVDGDPGDDKISTGGGVDVARGGSNNDQIDAGPGNDTNVHGNDNNDIVNGGPGADKLFGEADDDVLNAGPGDPGTSVDEMTGGAGNDTLNADGGGDKLWGDEGGLSFDCTADDGNDGAAGGGRDSLIGAAGNDQMHGSTGDDTLDGADDNDKMCGGGGNDEMKGGAGADTMSGNGGDDNMVGSTDGGTGDTMNGNGGRDYVIGDDGTLTRDGSNNVAANVAGGTAGGTDTMKGGPDRDFMWGQGAVDTMNGNAGNDEMHGGPANDAMHGDLEASESCGGTGVACGDDEMYGDDDVDTMHGDDGNDYMRGGAGTDTMDGDPGNDEMYGDGEVDTMRGGANDDLMRGGGGDDKMQGNGNDTSALPLNDSANPNANANFDLHLEKNGATGAWTVPVNTGGDGDVMYGDAGQDDIVGGSSGGSPPADSGDTILGNVEQDVIVGDNGSVTRPGGDDPDGTHTRSVSLTDPGSGIAQADGDYIQGNTANDDVYAGDGGDLVHGDEGDDYVEGNGDSDGAGVLGGPKVAAIGLYGDVGQDDLIGGTSQSHGGIADGGDDIWGGQGEDVIAGDNASIGRTGGGTCSGFVCNTFRVGDAVNVVIRVIQIWDVATVTTPAPAGTSGGDTINGEDAHDRIYGQGGGDHIQGGLNDDFVFGNAGDDTIFGNEGQDDLIGGTGRTDSSSPSSAADGRLDGADTIHGNDSFDAIAGDNARMVRSTTDADTSDNTGLWKTNTFNAAIDRTIALMDVGVVGAPASAGTSGNDKLLGDDQDDVIYGQGGNDGISGGNDQDVLEGNANGTGNAPNPDATAYPTWPNFAGDVIHGDAGADDIAGGTGWIFRMVGGVETCDTMSPPAGAQPCNPLVGTKVGSDLRLDGGDTIFGDGGGDAIAGDNTVIERALEGGAWILDNVRGTADPSDDLIRRIMRERDVATVGSQAPLTNGTAGGDLIQGNDGDDVAYGQGADDSIEGNLGDDHLEGNAGDDGVTGGAGEDDLVGGSGRAFSNVNDSSANGAADGRIDDADVADQNDTLNGGDGAGGVPAGDDFDVIAGDNATVDRELGTTPTVDRLPFNGSWQANSWNAGTRRAVKLLDVGVSNLAAPDAMTSGADLIRAEADDDVIFGQGGNDGVSAGPGEDYAEGNANGAGNAPKPLGTEPTYAGDEIFGNDGQDDITGGGSANNGVVDSDRNGQLDPNRNGETLRDAGDYLVGDSGGPAAGDGDVIAGDNARIHRLLTPNTPLGAWRTDDQRGTRLRDVTLFDIRIVGNAEPGNADPSESGADTIFGNGGRDILFGQDNGTTDNAAGDAYGNEDIGNPNGPANCQDAATGPGTGTVNAAGEEEPVGDNDNDDLPDINDPQCRNYSPGDNISGEGADDYIEGNQASDTLVGGGEEDDIVGGSSSNNGHINVILPLPDREASFTKEPNDLNDGHDVIKGNEDDDTLVGDNAFVDRYIAPGTGAWITITGGGHASADELDVPNPEPAKAAWETSSLTRRDVTMKTMPESAGAFGNDFAQGGVGEDDIYGTLGNDWLEGNENEDAIVGDMGKIIDNVLGTNGQLEPADPPQQFIEPQQPFLGATINATGILKREVTLYAFTGAQAGVGHDIALGGSGNDWIHTGPGEDLANGNAGDDRIFLGDNFRQTIAQQNPLKLAHDRVDAGWGGDGYDHLWGGYGADYLDVRPRHAGSNTGAGQVPGLTPTSDPETWFQVAGPAAPETSHNGNSYNQDNFEYKDYIYGGWDQDTMQANIGDNGPHIGDRNLDWSGSYNGYYLCPSTYGDWVSTRAIAPGLIEFLQQMAQGDGATTTATSGTSGFRETAIVFSQEVKDNTKPIHPDTPAHFTCGPGIVGP